MNNNQTVILVVASEGFQPIEYIVPKDHLKAAGINVLIASNKPGGAVASDGTTAKVDLTIDQVNPKNYDGIFFVGGPGALEHLDNATSYHLLTECKKHDIAYGAICISVRILAKAGVLKRRNATGWNGDMALPSLLEGFGAVYKDAPIVTDGLVVTATDPSAAEKFAQGILRVLKKEELR